MNVTINRADGSVGLVLDKVEQDTLEHAVRLAQKGLRQLKGLETGLVAVDPTMVEELRSVILALKCGACGAIDASKALAAAGV
jgi:hypothetical protein